MKQRDLEKVLREEINRADPIGLISLGAPADEYVIEVRKIEQGFNKIRNGKALEEFIYKTFVEMFDAKLAGPKSVYLKLSNRIYRRLKTQADAGF